MSYIHAFIGIGGIKHGEMPTDIIEPDEYDRLRGYIRAQNPKNETVIIGAPYVPIVDPEDPIHPYHEFTVGDGPVELEDPNAILGVPTVFAVATPYPFDCTQASEPPPIRRFIALGDTDYRHFDNYLVALIEKMTSNASLYGKETVKSFMAIMRLREVAQTEEILDPLGSFMKRRR
ncbi:hypothetical protein D6779_04245, partial [Candidatus Parcubacteria bacterium]